MTRYLTKSRFKLALECPTKLFYTSKKEYKDNKLEDDFLRALAEGGFQIGELAKLYYPGGINIDQIDHDEALKITEDLLKNQNVIIFEGAFRYNKLFIRADVIVKDGNNLRLIEVKSKTYDPASDKFIGSRGGLTSEWKPYIFDIAFQKYVLSNAHPEFNVTAYLCLADKSQKTTVDGLNQMFLLYKDGYRTRVRIKENANIHTVGNRILTEINVDEIANRIINSEFLPDEDFKTFVEIVNFYSEKYENDKRIFPKVLGKCKTCEFKATSEERVQGYKSGFHECWQDATSLKEENFDKPLILDIWDFRRKDELIKSGMYFMEEITRTELEGSSGKKQKQAIGLSRLERQLLQVEKATNSDQSHYIDINGLQSEMSKWKYPLHFIDFETTSVAIPFNLGRSPYEQVAFQFSHHIVYENGNIEHSSEWINMERGLFPNFQFVRELKNVLEKDQGSIFRYANHENSILNAIYKQLQESAEPDMQLLCEWIQTITKSKSDSADKWEGERNMIDLLEIVKKYYYNPLMKGSNSLKHVLPAILNTSDHLKSKYSKPIYGAEIKSSNYKDYTWITIDQDGLVINPYNLLPPINFEYNNELLDTIAIDDESEIADGGAAMIAYARMQFTEMSDEERRRISKALLRYCELDTLAMVMLWEAWYNWCN
jgi:hypothetical protein